jgi:hypothetical protein
MLIIKSRASHLLSMGSILSYIPSTAIFNYNFETGVNSFVERAMVNPVRQNKVIFGKSEKQIKREKQPGELKDNLEKGIFKKRINRRG